MLLKLRVCNIIATMNFVLFSIDMVVDCYFALQCDLSTNSYLNKYDSYGSIFFCIGYYTLYWIFVLKLKNSFKDSLFQVSKLGINMITGIGIIGTLATGIVIVFLLTENFYTNTTEADDYKNEQFVYYMSVSFGLSMLFYIIGNLLLSYQLFSKLYQYLQFVTLASDLDIEANIDRCLNNSQNKNIKLYHVFIRLVIVYTCAILSTFVLITLLTILFDMETKNGDIMLANQIAIWFRLLLMVDQTINICCLLFQNDSAIYFYKKTCCLCHTCVIKIVKISMIKSKGIKANVNTAPSSETQD